MTLRCACRSFGLPARLPVHLRPVGGGAGRRPHRRGPRRRRQQLHRRGDLREGVALRRTHPSSGSADPAAAAHRAKGRRAVPPDFAGPRRSTASPTGSSPTPRGIGSDSGLAVLLCRHDGTGAARRHQPAAPRHALFPPEDDDLHVAAGDRLAGRRRRQPRRRSAGDGEVRPDRGVGRQSGLHPGQCHDPCRAGAEGARREAGGDRSLQDADRRGGRHASGAAAGHRCRAGLRGDACRVPRRLCRP